MPPSLVPARTTAHANIALAKYWGKSDVACNLPAVPSISLTLEELVTETGVCFEPGRKRDELLLDGRRATAAETRRAAELLDRVRSAAGIEHRAIVTSTNHFPTAAGLASSASAARSVLGGFVELDAGARGEDGLAARPIAPPGHWDLRLVLAITAAGPKSVGSTEAMERSRTTSPFYDAWIASAPRWCDAVRRAIRERDLEHLGTAMEQSTLSFHCCAITSQPSTLYWSPATVAALRTVPQLRASGVPVWSTMDAGPHVKALCEVDDATRVGDALRQTPGVLRVLFTTPGAGVEVDS